MPGPLILPALPWIGKALIGTLGTLGLYPVIKNTTESAREYVRDIDLPSFNKPSIKLSSEPAVATHEPDNHTNLLRSRSTSPYIDDESASISSLTGIDNIGFSKQFVPGDTEAEDAILQNEISSDSSNSSPKKDNNKGDNNNNNKNKNYLPWILGLGTVGYVGYQGYQGYKEAEKQKEKEELTKENQRKGASLKEAAAEGAVRKKPNGDSTSNTDYSSTSSSSNKKPNTNKLNIDSMYQNKKYGGGW